MNVNNPSKNSTSDLSSLDIDSKWFSDQEKDKAAMQVSEEEVAEITARSERPGRSKVIRKATMHDVEQLYLLYKAVTWIFPDNIIPQENEITVNYVEETLSASIQRGFAIVIEKDNKIIGYMRAYTSKFRRFAHILSDVLLIVHPDYLKHGYGALLSMKCSETVKSDMRHIQMLKAVASSSNKEAVNMYLKFGYESLSILKNGRVKSDGTFEDEVMLTFYNPTFNEKALHAYQNYLLTLSY